MQVSHGLGPGPAPINPLPWASEAFCRPLELLTWLSEARSSPMSRRGEGIHQDRCWHTGTELGSSTLPGTKVCFPILAKQLSLASRQAFLTFDRGAS